MKPKRSRLGTLISKLLQRLHLKMAKRKSTDVRVGASKKKKEEVKKDLAKPSNDTFECSICMETKPKDDKFHTLSKIRRSSRISSTPLLFGKRKWCHAYCTDCMAKHIEARVQQHNPTMECPNVKCRAFIKFESCIDVIPKKVLDRWEELLSKRAIPKYTSYYCPYSGCSGPIIEADIQGCEELECPYCKEKLCAKCKLPSHEEKKCSDNQDGLLKELAEKKHWGKCPNCDVYIDRISGCDHMTCRCRLTFCYRCSKIKCECRR